MIFPYLFLLTDELDECDSTNFSAGLIIDTGFIYISNGKEIKKGLGFGKENKKIHLGPGISHQLTIGLNSTSFLMIIYPKICDFLLEAGS